MDFAANAVADLIAPPPARSAAATPADTSGPSFHDHVQAAQDARETHANDARDARDAARADQADRTDSRADDSARSDETAAPADHNATSETAAADRPASEQPNADAAHATQTPAPLLVQLIAANQAQTQQPAQTPAQTAPAIAASANTPAPPEAPVVVAEATQATPSAGAAGKRAAVRDAKNAKIEESSETLAPQTEPVAAPVKTSEPQRPPQVSADTDDSSARVASAPAHDGPGRGQKSDGGAKFEAPTQPASARNDAADSAPPPANTAKPASAARPAVAAAQAADALAPAPLSAAPSASAASIQMPAQTQHIATADQSGLRAAPVASQVGHEIVRRFNGGNTSFDIRLDPPELGRVDVRLEVSRDQRVTATISADNPQALHELARHARDLEQTLQSAGLELSDSGLSFDLRQGGDDRAQADNDSPASSSASARADAGTTEQTPIARPRLESWRGVRVDMMV